MSKAFGLGEVLSVTTGRLLSRSGMDGLYELLNYMTGDNLFTHQLPRAAEACKGPLLEQYPQLADVDVSAVTPDNWREEIAKLETKYGKRLLAKPLKPGIWGHIDPLAELDAMVGSEGPRPKIIIVGP